VTSSDVFIVGCLVLYLAALALFICYARQNSQPPRPEEVRDVREDR
jgi:hypothetical protein